MHPCHRPSLVVVTSCPCHPSLVDVASYHPSLAAVGSPYLPSLVAVAASLVDVTSYLHPSLAADSPSLVAAAASFVVEASAFATMASFAIALVAASFAIVASVVVVAYSIDREELMEQLQLLLVVKSQVRPHIKQ